MSGDSLASLPGIWLTWEWTSLMWLLNKIFLVVSTSNLQGVPQKTNQPMFGNSKRCNHQKLGFRTKMSEGVRDLGETPKKNKCKSLWFWH